MKQFLKKWLINLAVLAAGFAVGVGVVAAPVAVVTVAREAHAAQRAIKLTGFASCTPITNVALSTSSEEVFAATADRKSAIITNNDASISIYVASAATATSAWERVPPGGSWSIEPKDGRLYLGAITAIAASGTPAIGGSQCQ